MLSWKWDSLHEGINLTAEEYAKSFNYVWALCSDITVTSVTLNNLYQSSHRYTASEFIAYNQDTDVAPNGVVTHTNSGESVVLNIFLERE